MIWKSIFVLCVLNSLGVPEADLPLGKIGFDRVIQISGDRAIKIGNILRKLRGTTEISKFLSSSGFPRFNKRIF
jgi:hypothetical protein